MKFLETIDLDEKRVFICIQAIEYFIFTSEERVCIGLDSGEKITIACENHDKFLETIGFLIR